MISPNSISRIRKSPKANMQWKILLADEDQSKFPIGAQGSAAIYTSQGAWAVLRQISIRTVRG